MNIVLLAPPAAGKGTQAKILKDEYQLVHISTGDLLREASKQDTPLGKKIQMQMESGGLVDDEIVLEALKLRIDQRDCQNGFILDGVPRNLYQAKEIDSLLEKKHRQIDYVFYFETKLDTLKNRIMGRRVCEKCGYVYNVTDPQVQPKKEGLCDICGSALKERKDDTIEVFEKRYQTYLESTMPLIEYYEANHNLYHIDCNRMIPEITEEIKEIVRKRDDQND